MKLKSFSIALSGMFLFFCYTCSSSHGWKQISSVGTLSNNEIGSIVFFNVFEGIAISPNELIQTNDGGETWKVVFHNKGASYKKIVKTSAESALVIGSDVRDVFDIEDGNEPSGSQKRQPTILKTDNRGADWDKVTIEPELLKKREDRFPSFTDLCVDKNGVVWIVGDNGIIQAKLDNDNLKIDSVTAKDEAFVAINCRNSGDIIAVGVFGVLLNHQGVWAKFNTPIDNKKSIVWVQIAESDGYYFLVGNKTKEHSKKKETSVEGVLFRSRDNGDTWEDKTPSSASGLFDIHFDKKNGWLVGREGTIFRTTNTGDLWTSAKSPTKNDLTSMFFLDSNHGWAVGDKFTILKYED